MKKLSTEITTKKGEIKIITVEVDDMYADWLVTQPQEIYHDAVMFEYRTSCTERKETRYVQSLDASMDNGFDIADENVDVAKSVVQQCENERLYTAMKHLGCMESVAKRRHGVTRSRAFSFGLIPCITS